MTTQMLWQSILQSASLTCAVLVLLRSDAPRGASEVCPQVSRYSAVIRSQCLQRGLSAGFSSMTFSTAFRCLYSHISRLLIATPHSADPILASDKMWYISHPRLTKYIAHL